MSVDFIRSFFPDEPIKPGPPTEKSQGRATSAPTGDPELTPDQLVEAHRIASELVKLHKRGFIKDANDPETRFYAVLLHQSGGTVIDADNEKSEPTTSTKFTPTAAQLVKVPHGLRGKAAR